jgi:hypothetical protein
MRPEIVHLPSQKMAVVHTLGDPERVMHLVLPPLCSSVYGLKCERRREGRDFKLDHFRVRWLDTDPSQARHAPRAEWHAVWGLPIPADTTALPQRYPHVEVELETWEYGTVAQLTYRGPGLQAGRAHRQQSEACLREFIARNGYAIAGPLEEEFLVGPEPRLQRTRLRLPIAMQPVVAAADLPREGGSVLLRDK